MGSAVALSPIGLRTGPEAAYALGSLRIARRTAQILGHRTARVAGSPLGRTLAFWQLVACPRRLTAEAADGALRDLTRSPGFEATRRAVRRYRLTGFSPGVPVTIAWGTRDYLTPRHQAHRAARPGSARAGIGHGVGQSCGRCLVGRRLRPGTVGSAGEQRGDRRRESRADRRAAAASVRRTPTGTQAHTGPEMEHFGRSAVPGTAGMRVP
ncbi:hypothetical protein [Streptomyces canus]|uniref:hypothetical protein n=1 Tax=Streptomyces canus TaxID=58343 RepID=UPI003CF013CA